MKLHIDWICCVPEPIPNTFSARCLHRQIFERYEAPLQHRALLFKPCPACTEITSLGILLNAGNAFQTCAPGDRHDREVARQGLAVVLSFAAIRCNSAVSPAPVCHI